MPRATIKHLHPAALPGQYGGAWIGHTVTVEKDGNTHAGIANQTLSGKLPCIVTVPAGAGEIVVDTDLTGAVDASSPPATPAT